MPTPDYGRRTREYAGLLDRFLESRRSEKFRRFIAKLNAGYVGPNILAEGDSWFEYPYAKDLLVWLGEPYAVLSLAKAGDSFAEVNARKELMPNYPVDTTIPTSSMLGARATSPAGAPVIGSHPERGAGVSACRVSMNWPPASWRCRRLR